MSKRALGKGLDALFVSEGENKEAKSEKTREKDVGASDRDRGITRVAVSMINPNPHQPRKTFDDTALRELAESIKQKGVLQPIILQETEKGCIIVAGERRFRAAQLAGLKEIPAVFVSYSEEERLEIALIENLQREDLLPIDEALAYEGLIKTTGYSQDELAKKLGKNRSTIANSLRLLKLSNAIQTALQDGRISSGHARAILSVKNDLQEQLFQRIVAKGLSVRQAEKEAAAFGTGDTRGTGDEKREGKTGKREKLPAELKDIENKLIDIFGTKIAVKGNLDGGKIEIDYYSIEDLERIYEIVEKLRNK